MDDAITKTIEAFRLDGLQGVVTGASRGLGKGCALALAGAGADVTVVGRNQVDLDSVAEEIRAVGRKATVIPIDVTNIGLFADKLGELSRIDIFVNNAGTNRPQPFLSVDPETYDALMDVNLRGAFFAAQAAARMMVAAKNGGSIINMSSQAGHRALRDRTVYSASKFGLEGLTKAMAFELAEHSIRVNAVAPTFVETPLASQFLQNKDFRNYVEGKIRLPRLGQVDDVAAAVLYLASPAASMVTGTSLLVDGGWTIH
jgi:NAD(P)-dependent dehydrogenase (short-subunit alcohol dehydrogenase family)